MSAKGWIGVDLDGTLAEYHGWRGDGHVGPPVPAMLARVRNWLSRGIEVRIFTARVSGRDAAERVAAQTAVNLWCLEHVGQVLPVTCQKDYQMIECWDDRSVQVECNTGRRLDGGE